MFKHVHCTNTPDGHCISWELEDNYRALKVAVYGTYEGKEWVLIADVNPLSYCIVPPAPMALVKLYRVVGQSITGEYFTVDNIPAALTNPVATRLANEIRRREQVLMRAHPYGTAHVYIFMRRRSGKPCQACDYNCVATGMNNLCPVCYGTGIEDGYYLYPQPENMLLIDPRDDKDYGPAENMRSGVIQTFRSVFSGVLREYDLLMCGTELYDVIQQTVVASAANIPAAYMLTTAQLLPKEPRYQFLREIFNNKVSKYVCPEL